MAFLGRAAAAIALGLGACSVGPDYERPTIAVPAAFGAASEVTPAADSPVDHSSWWQWFGDDGLTTAIEQALEANHDLRIAVARVDHARALRRAAAADLGPALAATGSATRLRQSKNTILGRVFDTNGVDLTQNTYALGAEASWELDIFGGVRRGIQAADARVEATSDRQQGVRIALIAEVARVWIERAGTLETSRITENQVELQQQTLAHVDARLRNGLGRALDRDQALAQLEATRASLPSLRAALEGLDNRLAVLLGRPPGSLDDLPLPHRLPATPPSIPLGLPGSLLARRPDVRAAERELAAATADIGVATAELYPRFFVFGAASLQSVSTGDLLSAGSRAWQIGPAIRWRLFESGRVRAEVAGARAAREAALAAFERSVLVALEEVESAASTHARERQRRATLAHAAESARNAARRARALHDSGLARFLTVLDAERRRNEAEQALVQSEIAVRTSAVGLYHSLGGGWQESPVDIDGRGESHPPGDRP